MIRAIEATCRGVKLWGQEAEVLQEAFGDDWAGVFAEEGQLQQAWGMWRAWAEFFGHRLGVQNLKKTVVTGRRVVDGVAREIEDPRLPAA